MIKIIGKDIYYENEKVAELFNENKTRTVDFKEWLENVDYNQEFEDFEEEED